MTKYIVHAIFLPTGKVKHMTCGEAGLEALRKSPHWHIFKMMPIKINENCC